MTTRILHIFGSMDRGGAEMRTLDLMPEMQSRGFHFDYCALRSDPGALDPAIRDLGGEILTCPADRFRFSLHGRFKRLLVRHRPDIVHSHVHLLSGLLLHAAARANIPGRIAHFRSTGDGRGNSLPRYLYREAMRRLVRKHATAVLAVSEAAMSYGYRKDWRDDPRAGVIYNGLRSEPFQRLAGARASVFSEFDLAPDTRLIVMVGRLTPAKAHDTALRVFAKLRQTFPEAVLLLVGEGPRRALIETQVKALGLKEAVYLAGLRDDVPRLLAAADCSLLTSRWEGLPGAVLESLAARSPVVATALPGVLEISRQTDGIQTAPVDNIPGLTARLSDTLQSASQPPPLPKIFTIEHTAEQLISAYRMALSTPFTVTHAREEK